MPTDPRFVNGADLVRYIRSLPEYTDMSIAVAGYIPSIYLHDILLRLYLCRLSRSTPRERYG